MVDKKIKIKKMGSAMTSAISQLVDRPKSGRKTVTNRNTGSVKKTLFTDFFLPASSSHVAAVSIASSSSSFVFVVLVVIVVSEPDCVCVWVLAKFCPKIYCPKS